MLNIRGNFFDDNVIIVTLSANKTQCIGVLFFSPVGLMYHDSQVTNCTKRKKSI